MFSKDMAPELAGEVDAARRAEAAGEGDGVFPATTGSLLRETYQSLGLERFVAPLSSAVLGTLLLRLTFAFVWGSSGLEKLMTISSAPAAYFGQMGAVMGRVWVDGTATVPPNPFPFMAPFLKDVVAPNTGFFVTFIAVAEVILGLSLLSGLLVRPAAVGGMMLNVVFFLAAGHTSEAVAGVNIAMFGGHLYFLIVSAGRAYGLDAHLHRRFAPSGTARIF